MFDAVGFMDFLWSLFGSLASVQDFWSLILGRLRGGGPCQFRTGFWPRGASELVDVGLKWDVISTYRFIGAHCIEKTLEASMCTKGGLQTIS